MKVALQMIHDEGLPQVLARHRRLSTALRAGCAAWVLRDTESERAFSDGCRAAGSRKINGGDIVSVFMKKHRTVIAGSRNRLSGKSNSHGTMGISRSGYFDGRAAHSKACFQIWAGPLHTERQWMR